MIFPLLHRFESRPNRRRAGRAPGGRNGNKVQALMLVPGTYPGSGRPRMCIRKSGREAESMLQQKGVEGRPAAVSGSAHRSPTASVVIEPTPPLESVRTITGPATRARLRRERIDSQKGPAGQSCGASYGACATSTVKANRAVLMQARRCRGDVSTTVTSCCVTWTGCPR